MTKPSLHLVCNAHLDPVWLWEWEEGAAEALSTFRTAADLIEEFPGFTFCHNEATLYRWVEEYEPALFQRIQKLVKAGRWRIMGGWHLQPDCNMPSGESFVRQALSGLSYFREKFGVRPTTAINLDPFGHTQGLVQILAKCGYDSYVFCRPSQADCVLPADRFLWVGYDGSTIRAQRINGYASGLGHAREKMEAWLGENPDQPCGLVLWGVGNHGGGPSRQDLRDLRALMTERKDLKITHSTPEGYWQDVAERDLPLPRHERDLNPWAIGCYTSQVRIKQHHRRLENELYALEKMATGASLQGLMAYPAEELDAAFSDLLTCEFHDVLPGSSIQSVEEMSLRVMDHGLELASRAKARTFFALASGQPAARPGEIPLLVYNPHPYRVRAVVECEFMLADQNYSESWTTAHVFSGRKALPTQIEKEDSNLNLDWRKRVVFAADLQPAQMNRFDCRLEVLPAHPALPSLDARKAAFTFAGEDLGAAVSLRTGLLERLRVGGVEYLAAPAGEALVMRDDEDPWGMRTQTFRKLAGKFRLMTPAESARHAGVHAKTLPPVRLIEDGPVRTVVEAAFRYRDSFLLLTYKLPKQGTEIEIVARVQWNEKDRVLKLALPLAGESFRFRGQVAYGVSELPQHQEAVAQKWVAVVADGERAATVINDGVYGSDLAPALAGLLRPSHRPAGPRAAGPLHAAQ
jgi:alpha-mannosidase